MGYPYEIVLEALSYVFAERQRMLQALVEMGHDQAFELTPIHSPLGTPNDQFVLVARPGGPQIARYHIVADGSGCKVVLHGTKEFVAKLAAIAQRD